MPKDKTCEFCGKEGIDGRHINLCSKNPKNMSESISEITTPFFEPLKAEPIPEPEIIKPLIKTDMKCPNCGSDALKLNAFDCRCPKCGDIEFLRVTKPAGV